MMKASPIALLAVALLAGCSSADADLDDFIARTKQEQPAGVEPLPEVKPYESFFYTTQTLRSPFMPGGSGESSSPSVRPDSKRNREFLEQFSLDTLKMVGTLTHGRAQLRPGEDHAMASCTACCRAIYLGQNEGRITQIEAFEDQCYRNRSGRTRRLHGARRRARTERMTGRETMRMNRYIAIPNNASQPLLVAALCATTGLLAVPVAIAADAPANKLQSIEVQPLSGQGVQLVMTTSGPAPEPLSFTIDNPARISLDLPDTALALAQRRIDVRSGGLDSILAAEGQWPLAPGAEPGPHAALPDPRRRQQASS